MCMPVAFIRCMKISPAFLVTKASNAFIFLVETTFDLATLTASTNRHNSYSSLLI